MGRNEVQPIKSKEEIQKMKKALLRHSSYRDYILFTLGINVGLHVTDLLKLQVRDVRYKSYIKFSRKRTIRNKGIQIPPQLQDIINDYSRGMREDDWLFPSRRGNKAITIVQAYRILVKAAKKSGIENIGTHSMRKTFGYHFYKRTMDIATLMEIFNHPAPSVTKHYIGITPEDIDQSLRKFML